MTDAERAIRQRISAEGRITFADFMELALYHPDGYYAGRHQLGPHGDYFTSPMTHPAFGAMIALQLRVMWETLDRPSSFWLIEPGAGDGVLSRSIVGFAVDQLGQFGRALRYVTVDRASLVQTPLSDAITSHISAFGLPFRGVVGCVLSNELLDAFPVHRFRIVDGSPREVYVTVGTDGGFEESLGEPSTDVIQRRLDLLAWPLSEGYLGEVNVRMDDWIRDVATALSRGYVLTIDYGAESDELYSESRRRGTLQTYYRHVDGSSPYQRVGRQDLTAHVDFTALIAAGRRVGLRPVFLTTQAEFLKSLGLDLMTASIRDRSDARDALRAVRELVDPSGLGGFRVLVQEKSSGIRAAADLIPNPEQIAGLTPPPMTEQHLRLLDPKSAAPQALSLSHLWPDVDPD